MQGPLPRDKAALYPPHRRDTLPHLRYYFFLVGVVKKLRHLCHTFVSRFAKLSKHLRTKRALYTLKKSPMPFLRSHLNMYMLT